MSIKNQLLISFLLITLLLSSISLISFFLLNKSEKIRTFKERIDINADRVETLHVLKLRFLLDEVDNYEFHKTETSHILKSQDSINALVTKDLSQLQKVPEIQDFNLKRPIGEVLLKMSEVNTDFNDLKLLILKRGFKDFGLVGQMRKHIHFLEENAKLISLTDILMLRRHEKDFLLRNDSIYVVKLNKLINKICEKIELIPDSNYEIKLLKIYQASFNKLVNTRNQIGEIGQKGLMEQLNKNTVKLTKNMNQISHFATKKQAKLISGIKLTYISSTIMILLLGVLISYQQAHFRSKAIRELSNHVESKDIKNYSDLEIPEISNTSSELEHLRQAFNKLFNSVLLQFDEINDKKEALEYQNAQLKKVNGELDSFVYSVSHDLRSPLASVMGLIHLTKNESDINQVQMYNELKEKSIKKLDVFINDIINLSRNSRQNVNRNKIDFKNIVEDIYENYKFYDEAEKVEKILNVEQTMPFFSDQQRIKIVLQNLISNAIRYSRKYIDNAYVKVDVKVLPDKAEISVSDNGNGIEEKHLENIFHMFYRASDEKNGSGLGLYIVKEALEKINGSIEVTSKKGEGTLFEITIPV